MNAILFSTLCAMSTASLSGTGVRSDIPDGVPADTLRTAEVTTFRRMRGVATANPVQRIDSVALLRLGITDTGDALRRLAGVNVRDYGGAGGLKSVSVRGLGAAHTAVAYDGLCISNTRQGQIDLQPFHIDHLAGIELQTLDAAPLLCPVRNLGAAVIHLFSATAMLPAPHGTHGTFGLKQASFGTWNPSFSLCHRLGEKTALSYRADWFRAKNDYPFFVENGVASEHLRRTNSRMQSACGEVNLSRRTGSFGRLDVKSFFHHNHRRLPGPVVLYVYDNDERLTEQNAFVQARWTYRRGNAFNAFAAARYNWQKSLYTDVDAQYLTGAQHQNYRQREAYATAGAEIPAGKRFAMAYATDYAYALMNSNQKTDSHVSRDTWLQSLSARFHTARWQITARAVCHYIHNHRAGDADADNHTRLTPAFSASFQAVGAPRFQLYLRAGYKESFRMPTFSENYFYHLGDVNLKPETTRQFNAGITLSCAAADAPFSLTLTADAYRNKVRDRIVSVPYNLFVWRTVNMGKVCVTGADLVLESNWRPVAAHRLVLSANCSWQRAADRTNPASATYGRQLPYTPLAGGSASLAWENPWLSLVAHTTFASARWSTAEHIRSTRLPGYAEWGFAVYRTLRCGICSLNLRADLINAFNRRYEVIRRYPMPGRAYKLSVTANF